MKIIVFVGKSVFFFVGVSIIFFNCAVLSLNYPIGNVVSDRFIALLYKTQRRTISRSSMNSADAANQAEPSADKKRWMFPMRAVFQRRRNNGLSKL